MVREETDLDMYFLFKEWLFFEGYLPKKSSKKSKFVDAVREITGLRSSVNKGTAYTYMYRHLENLYPEDLLQIEYEARKRQSERLSRKNQVSYQDDLDLSFLTPF